MEQINITYYGHACFCLEAEGYRVVLDPYADGEVPGLSPLRLQAEAVLCSHEHKDHNALQTVTLQKTGIESPFLLEEFQTPHDDRNGMLRGMSWVRILQYGALRVAHLGDLGRLLTDGEAQKLRAVDCLLIPVGGYFTIDAATALSIVKQLQPRVVIPMHYRTAHSGYPAISLLKHFTSLFPQVSYGGNQLTLTPNTPKQILVLKPD